MTDFLFDRSVIIEFEDREDLNAPPFNITDNKIDFQVEKQISTEPNSAFIDIYNLSDDTAQKINFRKEILLVKFGKTIKIRAGFRGREKKIFQGVIIGANTLREGVNKITRIEGRNLYYELQAKKIKKTASKGQLKAQFIINIIQKDIGADLADGSRTFIFKTFGKEVFKDSTTFFGPAAQVINKLSQGLLSKILIAFDDSGVTFNPLGVALAVPSIQYSPRTGLIGTPQPTETGLDFKVVLDNELRINIPVIVQAETVRNLKDGHGYVVKKVIHAGINRAEGVWESRVESIFNTTPVEDFGFRLA